MFASALWETASQPLTLCCRNEAGLAAGALPPPPAGSAGAIGQVVGSVAIVRGTGAIEAAAPGMALFDGDFLQAAGSSVVVVLADGRRIAVQERGQLIVHAPGAGDVVTFEAAGGRFVVLGSSAPNGLPDLLVITPAARIHPGSAAIAFHHAAADGLRVMLAEDKAADGVTADGVTADGVVVENGFGRAIIRDGDEVVSVGGSDQPPVLEHDPSLAGTDMGLPREATAGLTLAEGLDVSPGGDMAAFPGDPVVSSSEIGLFDLAPQTLALPDPVSGSVSARDSPWPTAPRTLTELLLQDSQQEQADGGAPATRQLHAWEPLGLTWDILGDADVTPGAVDAGPAALRRLITPTEGGSMARLVSATDGFGPIDDFLGLPPKRSPPRSRGWCRRASVSSTRPRYASPPAARFPSTGSSTLPTNRRVMTRRCSSSAARSSSWRMRPMSVPTERRVGAPSSGTSTRRASTRWDLRPSTTTR